LQTCYNKSFINTRNRIEVGKGERHNQTNYTERTDGKKNTTAEAVIGGASPISRTVTNAVPNPLGDNINCEHCKPSGGGTTSTTRESFTTASKKQLPPIIDRFT